MTPRFARNGARRWLGRVFVLYVAFAVAAAAITVVAGPARLWGLLAAGPSLSLVLNAVIVFAFLFALVLVLAWLVRASREEAAVVRVWRDNLAEGAAPRTARQLDLSGVGRCAVRERVEAVSALAAAGVTVDGGSLAEALLDREEPRVAVARYAAGTLVLLGLLGTFVGLLVTISGVSDVLSGMAMSPEEDLEAFLVQLQGGLRTPLGGMAVAFSTSLLGLAGSLVLGAGALGLSAAQASWMGKLEELSAIALLPRRAAAAPLHAAAAPAAAVAPGADDASLRRLESSARLLVAAREQESEQAARLEAATARIAGAVSDFRDRVAGLAGQYERVEAVLARLADGADRQREGVNDVAVKLADLAGTAAALRADVRDGRGETQARLADAAAALRDGVAAALAELSAAVEAGPGRLSEQLDGVAAAVTAASAERRAEAERLAALLGRLGPPASPGLPLRPPKEGGPR